MHDPFVTSLEMFTAWRGGVGRRLTALASLLEQHDLFDRDARQRVVALRARLANNRLVLAFVGGHASEAAELIDALVLADVGRRLLPAATPPACGLELAWSGTVPARLALLPLEPGTAAQPLAELRRREEAWQFVPLDPASPEALREALAVVGHVRHVDAETARLLGHGEAQSPGAAGPVTVPAWRYALVNYPHPLLQRGLVVVHAPGPGLATVASTPSAHAVVYVIAAGPAGPAGGDPDLASWRAHLAARRGEPFVVLDEGRLACDVPDLPEPVRAGILQRCEAAARALGLPARRVFSLAARDALAARMAGDAALLARSRLPALEHALAAELVPRRHGRLARAATELADQLQAGATRRLVEQQREHAEQLLELRGLRGTSGTAVHALVQRLETEGSELERLAARIGALRAVQARLLRAALEPVGNDALRFEIEALAEATRGLPLGLGARAALTALFERLDAAAGRTCASVDELRTMLEASLQPIHAEFGIAGAGVPLPPLARLRDDLSVVGREFAEALRPAQIWRLAAPGFPKRLQRQLLARLRGLFEAASADVEYWARAALAPAEGQLRERRRVVERRQEALARIRAATGELERRIAEVEAADVAARALQERVDAAAAALRARVLGPGPAGAPEGRQDAA